MNLLERRRAAARAKHEAPWAEGELPRLGVAAKALARRDRKKWWRMQKQAARQLRRSES